MGKKRKDLSQEEIWDDSELIQSWNDSYEEYKLYHSIHARGERVEDVLQAAAARHLEANGANGDASKQPASLNRNGDSDEGLEDGEVEDEAAGDPASMITNQASDPLPAAQPQTDRPTHEPEIESTPIVPPVPQGMAAASTRDEALKDLMMSWYWAGYYTGLYEGQTKAGQATEQAPASQESG